MDSYTDSEVVCWWDFKSCPIPINCNPFEVLNNIRKTLRDEGHRGPISIKAFGNPDALPLSVRLVIFDVIGGYDGGAEMIEEMLFWITSHPPPATFLLITGFSYSLSHAIRQLETRQYKIMLVKPGSAFDLKPDDPCVWRSWETLSIGVHGSSSVAPYIFDRNSLLAVQRIFDYLCETLRSKKASFPLTAGKPTVVIFCRDGGSKTTNTSLKYASYYKKMGWKPTVVCNDTSSVVDMLTRNAALAEIPFFGIHTESNCVPIALDEIQSYIKSCGNKYDLIIVDIPIFVEDDDEVLKALEVDFVLFSVQNWGIYNVDGRLEDYDAGFIVDIEENITNQEQEFLDQFMRLDYPIVHVQRGDKFEAFDFDRHVCLILGACNYTLFMDDNELKIMTSYCTEVKQKRCSRHSKTANEVFTPENLAPNEILITAYKLWSETSSCKACSRCINMAYPEITEVERAKETGVRKGRRIRSRAGK